MSFEISEIAFAVLMVICTVLCLVCAVEAVLANSKKVKVALILIAFILLACIFSMVLQYSSGSKMINGQRFYLCLQVEDNGDIVYIDEKYNESNGHTSLSNAVAAGGDLNTYGKDIKFVSKISLLGFIKLDITSSRDVLYLNDRTATSLGVITQEEFDKRVDDWNSTLPASDSDADYEYSVKAEQ